MILSLLGIATIGSVQITVRSDAELARALTSPASGSKILIAPGEYRGTSFASIAGTAEKPITIAAADPANRPRFIGGLQFSRIAHVEIRGLIVSKTTSNGINIDDGGDRSKPSHHVTLRNITIDGTPKGNRDGIKLSGIDDFLVENCTVERWGGSGIDMVGCHRGMIKGCTFRTGGDNGVQTKGGSSNIVIEKCRFESAGQRGVNIGGSTGLEFFRPPVAEMPRGAAYEAKDITVQGCTFMGSMSPVAFVGVDGARVRFNTLYFPERWAIRILQETRSPEFVPSRRGMFEDNLIYFKSETWASGGVNIGDMTEPSSFVFARNHWFNTSAPDRSRPTLPTAEKDGIYGVNPGPLSSPLPSVKAGAHAFRS